MIFNIINVKKINITNWTNWKHFLLEETEYNIHPNCSRGICVDAGCNIGDFEIIHQNRFDKYVCFDVYEENIKQCIKNLSNSRIDIDLYKLAVWDVDDEIIDVMAYKRLDTNNLDHFGNSGSIGCIEYGDDNHGWFKNNAIDKVKTISIESIIKKYGRINLLKIDVEGSEYKFLLNKDLSQINYIVGEFHFEEYKKNELISHICKTHRLVNGCYVLNEL